MIAEFLSNACILITFISLIGIGFKFSDINTEDELTLKLIGGIFGGLVGIILILYSVKVNSQKMIDFRYIPLILSGIYGGFLCVIISSFEVGLFRLFYMGVSQVSLNTFITTIVIGIVIGIICKRNISVIKKWLYSIFYFFIIYFIGSYLNLGNSKILFTTIEIYFIGNILVSYIIYVYSENVIKDIILNRNIKLDAMKDFLTGLNNVRQFDVLFNKISKSILKKKSDLSILVMDIDHFKKINDTYGHTVGDMVLKQMSKIFINSARSKDVVSRNGGEEFSILLLNTNEQKALQIAECIRKKVEVHKFDIGNEEKLNVTISIGIATYSDDSQEIKSLYKNADEALYISKRTGRNKVSLYTEIKEALT